MTTYRIERVARRGKPLRAPELMHSRIVAENAASALAYYRQTATGVTPDPTDLRAVPVPMRGAA